jgi:small subunit ribosomal protein S4
VIQVRNKPRIREWVAKNLEMTSGREVPSWLAREDKEFSGTLVRIPSREDIAPVVDEQLVVELYSK